MRGPLIALEQAGVATKDVHITVSENNALLTGDIIPLPAGTYNINTTNIVIPAGQSFSDTLAITITNSMVLDPTRIYGVGFTISAIDQGYKIAANQRNAVIAFSIKNKYDGAYNLTIKTTGWGAFTIADGVTGIYPGEIELITASDNSVSLYSTDREDNLQPAFSGGVASIGAPTAFGATTPLFVFNTTNDKLVDVQNTTADDGRGRELLLNPAVTDSRFDPATRTIYAAYIMKQNGRPDQFIYDTLSFVRERD